MVWEVVWKVVWYGMEGGVVWYGRWCGMVWKVEWYGMGGGVVWSNVVGSGVVLCEVELSWVGPS